MNKEITLIKNEAYVTHRALNPDEPAYMTPVVFQALQNYVTKRAANKRVTMGSEVPRTEMVFGTRIPYKYMSLAVRHLDGRGDPITVQEIARAASEKKRYEEQYAIKYAEKCAAAALAGKPVPKYNRLLKKEYTLQTGKDTMDREISQHFLLDLLEWVRRDSGLPYQTLLVNIYEHGDNSVSPHSDDEASIIKNADIYSFSYGAGRYFNIKNKTAENYDMRTKYVQPEDRRYGALDSTLLLRNNELVVMRGNMQTHFTHEVPKLKRHPETGGKINPHEYPPRINITFRLYKGDSTPDVPQAFLNAKLDQYIRDRVGPVQPQRANLAGSQGPQVRKRSASQMDL